MKSRNTHHTHIAGINSREIQETGHLQRYRCSPRWDGSQSVGSPIRHTGFVMYIRCVRARHPKSSSAQRAYINQIVSEQLWRCLIRVLRHTIRADTRTPFSLVRIRLTTTKADESLPVGEIARRKSDEMTSRDSEELLCSWNTCGWLRK